MTENEEAYHGANSRGAALVDLVHWTHVVLDHRIGRSRAR
jgi:hypothetical protein